MTGIIAGLKKKKIKKIIILSSDEDSLAHTSARVRSVKLGIKDEDNSSI